MRLLGRVDALSFCQREVSEARLCCFSQLAPNGPMALLMDQGWLAGILCFTVESCSLSGRRKEPLLKDRVRLSAFATFILTTAYVSVLFNLSVFPLDMAIFSHSFILGLTQARFDIFVSSGA